MAKTWCTVSKSRTLVMMVVGLAAVHMMGRMVDRTYIIDREGEFSNAFIWPVKLKTLAFT